MKRFRRIRSLQKMTSVHASVSNHLNQDRSLASRKHFKLSRTAALTKWRGLCAEKTAVSLSGQGLVRICLPHPSERSARSRALFGQPGPISGADCKQRRMMDSAPLSAVAAATEANEGSLQSLRSNPSIRVPVFSVNCLFRVRLNIRARVQRLHGTRRLCFSSYLFPIQ